MSLEMQPEEVRPVAPRAGADLRAARERVGLALGDLAQAMHVRQSYLEALEAGRISELPGNAYALAFLRTYASMLGLDPDAVARRFKAEASEVTAKPELVFPAAVPERTIPAGAMALLGIALAVAAYAGWYRLSGEGRLPAEASLQIPTSLAPLADQALRSQAPAPVGIVAPMPAAPPPAQEAETGPPVPAISPGSAAAAVTSAAQPEPAPQPPRIMLRANADAWLLVRDRSGQVFLSRTLHAGETWEVPERPNLLLTTGNAGGTDLLLDGTATGQLGGNGVVRRDLPLDPDFIREGKLLPAGPRAAPQ
jgi:cytoskeleton protein RodZ